MEGLSFDPQIIWDSAGLGAATLVIGLVLGFVQSALPFIPSTGQVRNWTIIVLSAAIVGIAAAGTGKTLDDPNVVTNLIGGVLVFIGLYNAAKNAHGGGEAIALRTVESATPISTAIPDPK